MERVYRLAYHDGFNRGRTYLSYNKEGMDEREFNTLVGELVARFDAPTHENLAKKVADILEAEFGFKRLEIVGATVTTAFVPSGRGVVRVQPYASLKTER